MSDITTKPEPPAEVTPDFQADAVLWREIAEARAIRLAALEQRVMLVTGVVYGLLLALWIVMLHNE